MYYFAYGSYLSLKYMAERCPKAKPKFTAILPNYKVIFTDWSRKWRGGVATLRISQGAKVKGAIYEISARDLRLLDKHEDYPRTCDRMNVKVITADDEFIEAVTYIKPQQSEETAPSREYLAIIRQGYKDWRLG
jgi:cation transport regulator ChaC